MFDEKKHPQSCGRTKILAAFCGAILLLAILTGCVDQRLPAGLPDIYPCTLTILQEGQPLSGAMILLYSQNEPCPWTISGTTNEYGVAQMLTHGRYPGVPQGDWAVTIMKNIAVFNEKRTDGMEDVYAKVDPAFSDKNTTTLHLNTVKLTTEVFDVGPETDLFLAGASNLPRLWPCELTFTQNGQPLIGAVVTLESKYSPLPWPAGGVTDETGTAKILTAGQERGLPRGEYWVSVQIPNGTDSSVVVNNTDNADSSDNTDAQTTGVTKSVDREGPMEVTIEARKGKTAKTFDLGS